jgi:hypothetical protein
MKRLLKYKGLFSRPAFFWLALYGVLFALLQAYGEFHFYTVEQNQLFQNTWPYVAEHLMQPGGAALVLSEFLIQFFLLPYAGAAITAAWLVGAGRLAEGIVKRIAPGAGLRIACLLPAATLLFIHFDFNYLAWGTVAFLMAEAAFLLVLGIRSATGRLVAHLVAIPLLFYLAGPVFTLYAALALIVTFFPAPPTSPPAPATSPPAPPHKGGERKPSASSSSSASSSASSSSSSFPPPLWGGAGGEVGGAGGAIRGAVAIGAEAVLIGLLSVYCALFGEYRFACLPDGYYHPNLAPLSVIYFSWCSLALLVLLACILRKGERSPKRRRIGVAVQVVFLAALLLWGVPEYRDAGSYRAKELDYYSRTEQWDKILERCEGRLTNYLYIFYANLALLQKGELGDRMFAYDQRGPQGLLIEWNKTASISILQSDIFFAFNHIALSQEMAFEAMTGAIGDGNPRVLKRLVQTNLIYGAYPVAEKYISILEHTFCYRDWAKAHRRFLYNDAEVERDPLLAGKRRALIREASLAQVDGLDTDLHRIAAANPSDPSAVTYAGAYYLLEKNTPRFQALVERYYATPVLPSLPLAFQEAVIILSEQEPDYWQRFGVSESVAVRFTEYKRQVVEANRSGNADALPSLLRRTYGNTYWFYYMFK